MSIDRRERIDDPVETLRAALEGKQAEIWTALPGIIVSYNPDAMTVAVQPAVRGSVRDETGRTSPVNMPVLPDVPVVFPQGGGFCLTFPIQPGDECLVVFASRCIDGWWQSGGIQAPAEPRMHDLSDGFALVGVRSQARTLSPPPDTVAVQLRSDDGQQFISLGPEGVEIKTPKKFRVDAEEISFHAKKRLSWDVGGYGVSYTVNGMAVAIHTWQDGAAVTTEISAMSPPEGP